MDKLEKAARALCSVDKVNPDEQIAGRGVETVVIDDMATVVPAVTTQWEKRVPEARRILAVIEAISPAA